MWKKTLRVWFITLTQNPSLTSGLALLFTALNLLFVLPLGVLSLLLQNLITFSAIIYFSKLYLKTKGDEEAYKKGVKESSLSDVILSYMPHALFLVLANYALLISLFVLLVMAFILLGLLVGTSLLAFGTAPSGTLVLVYVLFFLFLYFSVVTSFPAFFARTVVEAKKPSDYFILFLTAPFSRLLWRISFSFELLVSSLIVGAVSLFLLIFKFLLVRLFPPLVLLTYFFGFVNLLLVYLFGVVSVSHFVWRGEER
ncbi:MAG: hypothetical protein GXO04_00805 [Aquificae bacterium]|nr:hypothetical protein [Aquificota bacterium]